MRKTTIYTNHIHLYIHSVQPHSNNPGFFGPSASSFAAEDTDSSPTTTTRRLSALDKEIEFAGFDANEEVTYVIPDMNDEITIKQEDVSYDLFLQCSGMQRKEIVTLVQAMRDYNLNGGSETELYLMTFGNRFAYFALMSGPDGPQHMSDLMQKRLGDLALTNALLLSFSFTMLFDVPPSLEDMDETDWQLKYYFFSLFWGNVFLLISLLLCMFFTVRRSKTPLATNNLLEVTDGLRRPPF